MSTITSFSHDHGDGVGLTTTGLQRAITAHCDLQGDREGRGAQRQSLRSMLGALVRQDTALDEHDLQRHFKPALQDAIEQGHYSANKYGRFWDEVAHRQLPAVPGVETTEGGLRFVGADPTELDVDDEYTRPLDELRADPRNRAFNVLDNRLGPHSDERENVLKLWDSIDGSKRIGESELERRQVFRVTDDYLDVLADLPGIEREVEQPPQPEDFSIDTYADVLEAEKAIEQREGAEVVWRSTDA